MKKGNNRNQEPPLKKPRSNTEKGNSSKLLDNWDRFDFRVLDVEKIYQTRSSEIKQVLAAIAGRKGPTRVFQTLPRHLRRRGMSHNSYLYSSRKIRKKASAEIILSNIAPKRAARSYRTYKRRMARLSSRDHNKRQQDKLWLETHIWHAKRFHMMNIWGYRLALTPTNKGRRASFRAIRDHAVAHDASYQSLSELVGTQANLISLLKSVSNNSPLCEQKHALKGDKYFNLMVYQDNLLLGPIQFLWKPIEQNESTRQLWLWSHPSFYPQFLELLSTQITSNNLTESIKIESMRDHLFRFELLGPKSNTIIHKLLAIAKREDELKRQFLTPDLKPSLLPPNCVFSLPMLDPRHFRRVEMFRRDEEESQSHPNGFEVRRRETKPPITTNFNSIPQFLLSWDPKWASSPLWDSSKREEVSCKVSEKQFCSFQPIHKLPKPTVCNLIFMRTDHGGSSDSFGFGWTIIGPISWAKPLWRSLVLSGARAIGIIEKREISFNSFSLHFPHDYPETFAGQVEAHRQKEMLEKDYNAKPKSKKNNYTKLGVEEPFIIKWNSLFTSDTNPKFLRSKSAYFKLEQQFLNNPSLRLPEFDDTLVCVWLSLTSKGTLLVPMSRIFIAPLPLPKTDNLKKIENQKLIGFLNTGGYDHVTGLCKGVGYVKLEDIIRVQFDDFGLYPVLVKNVDSQWLHQASLSIAFYEP